MTNPLLQGPPFDLNVGNQVQVNQVGNFMVEFLVALDLLLIMSSIMFEFLIRVNSLFKVLHFFLTPDNVRAMLVAKHRGYGGA